MGRDMTPRDLHKTDLMYPELKFTTFIEVDGKKKVLYNFSSEMGKKYPNLYFLFGEEYMKPLKPETLSTFEQYLIHIINADDTGRPLTFQITPEIQALSDWYHGKLDPRFYYRTANDRGLLEVLTKWEKNRKPT